MEYLAPNESIQLHDLLLFKDLCLTKSVTMQPVATDEELKSIMRKDANLTEQHISELNKFMNKCNFDPIT